MQKMDCLSTHWATSQSFAPVESVESGGYGNFVWVERFVLELHKDDLYHDRELIQPHFEAVFKDSLVSAYLHTGLAFSLNMETRYEYSRRESSDMERNLIVTRRSSHAVPEPQTPSSTGPNGKEVLRTSIEFDNGDLQLSSLEQHTVSFGKQSKLKRISSDIRVCPISRLDRDIWCLLFAKAMFPSFKQD